MAAYDHEFRCARNVLSCHDVISDVRVAVYRIDIVETLLCGSQTVVLSGGVAHFLKDRKHVVAGFFFAGGRNRAIEVIAYEILQKIRFVPTFKAIGLAFRHCYRSRRNTRTNNERQNEQCNSFSHSDLLKHQRGRHRKIRNGHRHKGPCHHIFRNHVGFTHTPEHHSVSRSINYYARDFRHENVDHRAYKIG